MSFFLQLIQSIRHIVLEKCTFNYLLAWRSVQQNIIKTNFVMSYNGIPTQKHSLPTAINRYAKLAGVHRITIHGLRHSHASLLISMGENPLIIKDRLGHEDIETTLNEYSHVIKELRTKDEKTSVEVYEKMSV